MKKEHKPQIKISKALLTWFEENRRDLPWRRGATPYSTWISEIMLQQTVVNAVILYFLRWMKRFPDIKTLAEAQENEILRYWEGLGYYSRAKNILKTAHIIREKYNCLIPDNYNDLINLPGIGDYTAKAILSIAFQKPFPVIDANVRRIIQRLLAKKARSKKTEEEIEQFLQFSIPKDKPGQFNEGLMELGQQICRSENPICPQCPFKKVCLGLKQNIQNEIPLKQRSKSIVRSTISLLLINRNRILLIKKDKGLFSGLWILPGINKKEKYNIDDFIQKNAGKEAVKIKQLPSKTHFYTKYADKLHPFIYSVKNLNKTNNPGWRWIPIQKLEEYPMPSVYRKIIKTMDKS